MTPRKSALYYFAVPVISTSIVLCSLTGCTDIEPANPDKGYVSEEALPVHEYTFNVALEISSVANQLTTRMAMADSMSRGEYDVKQEISNIEQSISTIESCRNVVDTLTPAKTYEDDRINVLELMDQTLDTLNNYKEILQSENPTNVASCLNEMKGEYASLTALANMFYQ